MKKFVKYTLLAVGLTFLACVVLGVIGQQNRSDPVAIAPAATSLPVSSTAPAAAPDQPTEVPAPSATAEPPAPTSFGVNQDVKVGDIRWKVIEAADLGKQLTSDEQYAKPKDTAGKFVRVRFEIENLASEPVSFTQVDLIDGRNRTFNNLTDLDVIMNTPEKERCALERLNPNLPRTCQVVFELPADATGLRLSVGDLKFFGGSTALIDLGF